MSDEDIPPSFVGDVTVTQVKRTPSHLSRTGSFKKAQKALQKATTAEMENETVFCVDGVMYSNPAFVANDAVPIEDDDMHSKQNPIYGGRNISHTSLQNNSKAQQSDQVISTAEQNGVVGHLWC